VRRYCETRLTPAILAATALLLSTPVTSAHSPTGGEREYTTSGATAWFFLGQGTSTLTWFITPIETALESDFEASNNTQTPNFLRVADDGTEIKYLLNSQVPDTSECPSSFWRACTEYVGTAKTTWLSTAFNSENPSGDLVSWWCDHPNQADSGGCYDLRRIALHEAGHGVGLARSSNGHTHQSDSAAYNHTVMQINGPSATTTGWNYRFLGVCDRFELSREYDVVSWSGAYPACIDHLTGVAFSGGKMISVVKLNDPLDACTGSAVALGGYLKLIAATGASDDGQLGVLAGNGLGGRTIEIFRRTPSGAYGSTPYTTATVANSEAGTWSRSVSSSTSGTWYFRAEFTPATTGDVATLNGDLSAEFAVTWSSPC
jgi:hypothetical protein